MTDHAKRLRLCIALALTCAAPLVAAADQDAPAAADRAQPAATAVDAAKDYARLMQSDRPADAVRNYWDVDAILAGIFGDHLGKVPEAERGEIRRRLARFVETVYANPAIAGAMKQAHFEDFKSSETKTPGVISVTFNVRIQDKVIPNTLLMKQVDGTWRVQDAGANGRMMVPAIRADYAPQASRVTPLEYIKAMAAPMPEGGSK